MSNGSNRGGRSNRGGQGQRGRGGGQSKSELYVTGPRNEVNVSVMWYKGNQPQRGESVKLYMGSDNNPTQYRVLKPDTSTPWTITIGDDGLASESIDFSAFPAEEITKIAAFFGGYVVVKDLPTNIRVPSKSAAKPKKTLRQQLFVKADVDEDKTGGFYVRMRTMDNEGNPVKKAISIISLNELRVKKFPKTWHSGRFLKLSTSVKGLMELMIFFDPNQTRVRFILPDTEEEHQVLLVKKLRLPTASTKVDWIGYL